MTKKTKRIDFAALNPVYEARHANLHILITQHRTKGALSARLGYSADGSFISQLAGDPPLRRISEDVARKIEAALGLADGWMDTAQKGGAA